MTEILFIKKLSNPIEINPCVFSGDTLGLSAADEYTLAVSALGALTW
jgi:hypothetical protein